MRDMPEAEARALLDRPLLCRDCGDFQMQEMPKGLTRIQCGLLDESGISVGMYVQLDYRLSPTTRLRKYDFSVFKQFSYGACRVYQLTIEQLPAKPKNIHAMPHEHFGCSRIDGPEEWLGWGFDAILNHFCARSNVQFDPIPDGPEILKLKG